MMRTLRLLPLLLFLLLPPLLSAQEAGFKSYPEFVGGNMRMIISMKGQMGSGDALEQQYGLYWPGIGSSDSRTRGLCFSSTPVLTGRVNGELRVSASYYRDNFKTGPILSGKPASNQQDPFFRAYTVNWKQPDDTDYRDWPVEWGAPAAPDGSPLFYGESQMYWIMNDLDSAASMLNNGCEPMGLEMRCLLYEPWGSDARDNTLLLQVTYINKGNDNIRDAYAGYFMDAELRDPLNDLAGSDSLRGMVYAYQGSVQAESEGMPTAMGVVMLQTPAVSAPGDSARWFEGWKSGVRNIPISAAVVPFKTRPTPITEPQLGVDETALWNALMQGSGKIGKVVNPVTGTPSSFWYSGDPVTGSGWLPNNGIRLADGQSFSMTQSDQRMLISAGPFDLAPGDTQQVTYAFIAARGASPQAAVHALRDRADFWQADFMQRPAALAYRSAAVRPPTAASVPGVIEVNARMDGNPIDLRVEVTSSDGSVLADEALDRFPAQNEWVYRKTVTLPQLQMDGVNISFIAEWNGETVRIPGRVSVPVGGSVDLEGIEMLEEGDGNGRVALVEEAKWFPRFVNHSVYGYDVYAQSYSMPNDQWLNVPDLAPMSSFPTDQRPWSPLFGYNSAWDKTLVLAYDSIPYRYDVFDPAQNTWWERQSWIPSDSTTEEWYDVLMTQVRGASDERPGVRLLDLSALQDKWYVATIDGAGNSRTISLHDSANGAPYFSNYGIDIFTGAAPVTDGFRVVRGTISKPGTSPTPITAADLFVFNPRHVLLARSQKLAAAAATVSKPSPMPLSEWTSVRVDLPESTTMRAEVYNLIGQRVKVLRDEVVPAGRHLLVWDGYWSDGRAAESGMYLLRIAAQGSEVTRKIIVVR